MPPEVTVAFDDLEEDVGDGFGEREGVGFGVGVWLGLGLGVGLGVIEGVGETSEVGVDKTACVFGNWLLKVT